MEAIRCGEFRSLGPARAMDFGSDERARESCEQNSDQILPIVKFLLRRILGRYFGKSEFYPCQTLSHPCPSRTIQISRLFVTFTAGSVGRNWRVCLFVCLAGSSSHSIASNCYRHPPRPISEALELHGVSEEMPSCLQLRAKFDQFVRELFRPACMRTILF
jgi:hypothetical protein